MRLLSTIVALTVITSSTAFAADPTCDARAKERKLAGAALQSFMTKCEKDSGDKCALHAKAKELRGAAETSFTKKCVKDAVGSS